jgi:hypothetical protein
MPRRPLSRLRRAVPSRSGHRWLSGIVQLLLLLAVAAAAAGSLVSTFDVPPRELAPHLRHRAEGHHPLLVDAASQVAVALERLDRGAPRSAALPRLRVGAGPRPATPPAGRLVAVDSVAGVLRAIGEALPGDVIQLQPGTYRFEPADRLVVDRAGTDEAPITLRAERPGSAVLAFALSEGFRVSAPYWTFENLSVRGVCERHPDCEHAFHVVGKAHHLVLRNNLLVDFNARVKVNGEQRRFPDDGLVEGNTLVNSSARQTASPVTPFDLVAASRWTVRGNLIADFVKGQGNLVSYGAFVKGAGTDNRFERNVVLCEVLLRGAPGWRVGLSLGGGGSQLGEYCRDGACVLEQERGVIDSNLVAGCSDDGIYVNRSAVSRVVHNTLIDTGGIVVRFPESSADVVGNLVDGTIRSRDGAVLRAVDNRDADMLELYVGWHPRRSLYRDPLALDLEWRHAPPRRNVASEAALDLCGATRPAQPAYGAFEDFSACMATDVTALTPP